MIKSKISKKLLDRIVSYYFIVKNFICTYLLIDFNFVIELLMINFKHIIMLFIELINLVFIVHLRACYYLRILNL